MEYEAFWTLGKSPKQNPPTGRALWLLRVISFGYSPSSPPQLHRIIVQENRQIFSYQEYTLFLTLLCNTHSYIAKRFHMDSRELLANFITELNRGTLTLCVLSQLTTPQYGYSLLQILSEKDIALEANTLYPMLRRLETQGVLESSWNTSENRPRKFYQLTEEGKTIFTALTNKWKEQQSHIEALLGEESHA